MQQHIRAKWLGLLALLHLLLLGTSGAFAQQGASIGKVAALQGQATVQRQGSPQPIPLSLNSPVFQEDVIRTPAAAKITLLLVDGSELTLAEQGTLTLAKFRYAPPQKTQNVLIRIAQGAFHAVTQKVLPKGNFEIRTSTAVAAVRGTDWYGDVTPEATAVFVMQGTVAVRHADTAIRGAALVTDGLGTDVRGRTPPTAPNTWGEERVRNLRRATALP